MQELDGSMGGESGQINSKRRTERWIYKWEGAEGWELGETRRRSRGEHLVRDGEIQKWSARLAAPVTELPFTPQFKPQSSITNPHTKRARFPIKSMPKCGKISSGVRVFERQFSVQLEG